MYALIYTGKGFLPGVPARDLTADEVDQYGGAEALVASGAYRLADDHAPRPAPAEEKPAKGKK